MKDYKGTGMPSPIIPVGGLVFGIVLPHLLSSHILPESWTDLSPIDSLLVILESFSLVSGLFFWEFHLGAVARSTSAKASFSPAAAQSSGVQPFAIVQANRIHQNHIESLCIIAPMALACAGASVEARHIVACIMTWTMARFLYRVGYCSVNPFWRIFGVTASMVQWMILLGLFVLKKKSSV
jgi:uncharacterized MAPEG superfamily protein